MRSLALFVVLLAACVTRQTAGPPRVAAGPPVLCEAEGVRALFDQATATVFEGFTRVASAPCSGTRMQGANFVCDAPGVRFLYESIDRPARLTLRETTGELSCHADRPCGTTRFCSCHAKEKRVRIDTQSHTAELDQGGTADCLITASAGVSTRCTGAGFTVEYDTHDFRWAVLDDTWLRCEPEP